MEFKDNLRQLRTNRGLTQAQLAEKLFVSRSTVAKWENGLGLPNPDAMAALEDLFQISAREMATAEPETVIVEKNRRLHLVAQIIGWTAIAALLLAMSILPIAIRNGSYGFTPGMAAGGYADRDFIDVGDCRIYYFSFEGDLEDGRHWSNLQGWKIVRKHIWGCTVSDKRTAMQVITKNNYVGRLYSIRGENGYYNIINKAGHYKAGSPVYPMIWDIPPELVCAESITVNGTEHKLQNGFFFITQEPIRAFSIGSEHYDVFE
ncbi:MAG: helix-turn-helix transcriptional regulator [Clostridia bacterium]|nr:helix-turn-helix transcriptional regulator [Clostridia bacterium]